MTLSRDKAGALAFLALAIAYGMFIQDIPLLPGDEMEPFNARTLPKALAWGMGIVSFLMLVLPTRNKEEAVPFLTVFKGLNWLKALALLASMVAYGLALKPMGFILATILFLLAGQLILGERRPLILFLASVPLVIAFWFILSQLLDIYLDPGDLFRFLGGQ